MRGTFVLVALAAFSVLTGSSGLAAQAPASMTNDDVIRLVKAGLGDDIIVAKIRESKATVKFDTSVDQLIKLKEAGVSDPVVKAMLGQPDTPTAQGAGPGSVRDEGPDAGVFVEKEGEWIRLEPTNVSGIRGYIHYLSGSSASVALSESKPKFLLSFGSLGSLMIMGPRDSAILKFKTKGDHRELKMTAALTDMTLPFTYEETTGRRYVITPVDPLPPGEYAVFFAGKYFDFKVVPSPAQGTEKAKGTKP